MWTLYSAESAEGGPPSSTIRGLLPLESGLWVTTAQGVGHFDGHRWQAYGTAGGASGQPSSALAASQDRAGWPFPWPGGVTPVALVRQGDASEIWFGTPYGIVTHRADGSWAPFPLNDHLPASTVTSLLAGHDGTVWIGTQSGLVRWNGRTLAAAEPPGAASSYFLALAEDSLGGLWAGTLFDGLHYFDGVRWSCFTAQDDTSGRTEACQHNLPGISAQVNALAGGGTGRMWIGTNSGLACLAGDSLQPLPDELAAATQDREILALWWDERSGSLWIGLEQGALRHTDQGILPPVGAETVSLGAVDAIKGDAEGNVWLGTDDGLWRYRYAWEPIRPDGQLTLPGSGPIVQDVEDGVWFGLGDFVARLAPDGTWSRTEPVSQTVSALLVHPGGQLWIGNPAGAFHYTAPSWKPLGLQYGPPVSVYALASSADGSVWLGTNQGLVHLAPDGSPSPVHGDLPVPHSVYVLLPDRDGELWAGTSHGLLHLPLVGATALYTVTHGLPDQSVYSLYRDGQGMLWVGTRRGVARHRDGEGYAIFERPPGLEALDGHEIQAIAQDPLDRLWFGTRHGAFVYSEERLLRFTLADGLASNDIRGLFQDRARRLWIATASGIQQYRPGGAPPWAGFHLWAGNDRVTPDDGALRVPWDRAEEVRVELDGGDLSTAFAELIFCYQMVGHDGEEQCTTDPTIPYDLPTGRDYAFRVTALDKDGHASAPAQRPVVVAQTPLTRRPAFLWFLAAVTGALLLVILGYLGNIAHKRWGETRVQKDIRLTLRQEGPGAANHLAEVTIRHQGLPGWKWRWTALRQRDLAGVFEPLERLAATPLSRDADLEPQLDRLHERLGLREERPWEAKPAEQAGERGLDPLGEALRRSAFPPALVDRLVEARQEGQNVRIRLSFDLQYGADLARLPWEYIYHPELGFLAQHSATALVRYLADGAPARRRMREPLRILVVIASPSDVRQGAIQTGLERARLEEALSGLIEEQRVELHYLVGPAAASIDTDLPKDCVATEALDQALRARLSQKGAPFDVVHFVGHAGPHDRDDQEGVARGDMVLYGENAQGAYAPLGRPQLVGLLQGLADQRLQPTLFLLNACQTVQLDGGQALAGLVPELISEGKLPAVIGMQYPVGDAAARLFAEEFYTALLRHGQVDWAISIARNALAQERGQDLPDWGMPVLYLQARDGFIFKTY